MTSSNNLLSNIKACLIDGENIQIDEALHLLRQYHDHSGPLRDVMSVRDDDELQLLVDSWKDVIYALEAHLETVAYTWEKAQEVVSLESTTSKTVVVDRILVSISQLYKDIATISSKYRKVLQFDYEEVDCVEEAIADCYLDWAIAAKKTGNMKECVDAHMKRMKDIPELVQTDAVRLLGLQNIEKGGDININEITNKGLFETQLVSRGGDDGISSYTSHMPTKSAIYIGKRCQNLFSKANYTLKNCTKFLQYALSHEDEIGYKYNPKRIYSANSFFSHRREVLAVYDELEHNDDIKVLALLFLFGVSLKESQVEAALGCDNVQVLFESALLTRNAADKSMVLAEVQIFPLSTDTFGGDKKIPSRPVYIITDWSLESLRLSKNAIMTIGYDSLELVALAGGMDVFSPSISKSNNSRVLDLCAGCGIQGIFSAKRSNNWADPGTNCELISMDINPRACHFVCANAALNDILSQENAMINSIEADLFTPLQSQRDADHLIGKVDLILSNPPFVAVPFATNIRLDSAFYAAGGGYDGMHLAREIVNKSFNYLCDGNGSPQLLMVTELPNVQSSCNLIETFFDDPRGFQINVAYIEDDVEQMEDYAKEREEESGQQVLGRNWNPTTGWVKDRALVLISISKDATCKSTKHGLFCFSEQVDNSSLSCDADEEDQFLTKRGIMFARRHLRIIPSKSKRSKINDRPQVEQLEHDALLPYISTSTPFARHVKEQIQTEGYVVIPNVLSREECEG